MNSRHRYGLGILGLLIVLINVVLFFGPFEKGATFWVADVFLVISVMSFALVYYLAYGKTSRVSSKLTGFPIFRVGYQYLFLQMIASLLLIIAHRVVPLRYCLMINLILLIVTAIRVIVLIIARNQIDEVDNITYESTIFIKEFREKIFLLCEHQDLGRNKQLLNEICEELRFSDPVSSPTLQDVENEMLNIYNQIIDKINIKNDEEVERLLLALRSTIARRKSQAKLYKKHKRNA